VSEPARRETATSTAQRTWSLVRGSWTVVEELAVVVGASVTGATAGRITGLGCPDEEAKSPAGALSSISMDATEAASRTSDSSAAIANLQVHFQRRTRKQIPNENGDDFGII
jgi:hypothetical protein